ncbi:MAG: SH3 domain-containing protein [Anaerolineae bacterium]|nr:SH3 domain-containing protein [Anaerolineae bacterium]
MKRVYFALFILVAVTLACNQPVPTTPTAKPADTRLVTRTPAATATSQWRATVLRAVVNVREKPSGSVIASLHSGDSVEIVECVGNWCRIKKPTGWIWRGCLSEVTDGLRCEAR